MLLVRNKTHGFTIVELIVVVVVIGLLATAGFVAYTGVQANARDKTVLSDIDTLDGIQTQYGIANNVAGKAWYSGSGVDADLQFTPSPGNVIDVVVNAGDYCIRGYNPSGNKNAIDNAYSKGSSEDACGILAASVAAGGSGDASLVGWWKLNGNALDSSGNSSNGGVSGASLTTGQTGQSNTGYSFNGTSNNIIISRNTITQPSSAITVSSWVKPVSGTPSGGYRFVSSTEAGGFTLGLSSNTVGACPVNVAYFSIRTSNSGGSYIFACDSSGTLVGNTWALVTGTYDGSTVNLYINGSLISTTSLTGTIQHSSTTYGTCLGGEPSTSACLAPFLSGVLDDMRIYSRALDISEVQSLYVAGAK